MIYKLLLTIKSFNKTIIIVTHDLDLINLGDEIIDLSPIQNRIRNKIYRIRFGSP